MKVSMNWISEYVDLKGLDLDDLIHCFPLVTPGLLPVFATALPANEFIKVDFPTFGIPTTMALTGRFIIPFFLSLSIF